MAKPTSVFRGANRPLLELGELSHVKGFDESSIERLLPFVSTLPVSLPINVNFASAEVLTAVIPDMSLSEARMLVQQRRGKPFTDILDFKQRLPRTGIHVNNQDFSVSSDFFWVTGRARVAKSQVTTQALLQRTAGWPTVVWQDIQ